MQESGEDRRSGAGSEVAIALLRPDETCSVFRTQILPLSEAEDEKLTLRYLERILKFLFWQRGGCSVLIAGCDSLVGKLAAIYSAEGARAFDHDFFGDKVYRKPLAIRACAMEDIPAENETAVPLGRHLDGCRIGFDLGGSDRKCAAVIDGEVVFSEEIEWNPYFENDPSYQIEGINDTLKRAAAHLPRVDAIGGSSAGVYVNNEVRVASLFRGVSPEDFESKVRRLFFDLQKRWGNVPFDVVNDGEVTALAGSMSMHENAVLGLAMGTSEAVGYVTPEGNITPMLNELAFAPIDYREDAPIDEWSGDAGVGPSISLSKPWPASCPPPASSCLLICLFPSSWSRCRNSWRMGTSVPPKSTPPSAPTLVTPSPITLTFTRSARCSCLVVSPVARAARSSSSRRGMY